MPFTFSARSKRNLAHVHPHLRAIAHHALNLSPLDFIVTSGKRSMAEQRQLVAQGRSRTLNSRHLTGEAIDIAVLKNGTVTWDIRHYRTVSKAFKKAAADLGHEIEWGGDWQTFKDGPHFQLPRTLRRC